MFRSGVGLSRMDLGVYLLDGSCVADGVDGSLGAQHSAVLVRDNASEVCLGALWKPLLHVQSCITSK